MKNIGLFIASIGVFMIVVANLYYNSITLDMQMIKDYVLESNIIQEDIVEKEDYVAEKKGEYISRLITIKKGIENTQTTFFINEYKKYKVKSIEFLIESISQEKYKEKYINEANEYNKLCEKELSKLVKNNLTE